MMESWIVHTEQMARESKTQMDGLENEIEILVHKINQSGLDLSHSQLPRVSVSEMV